MTKKTRAKARRALLTLSLVLVVAFAAVSGTIAWLTDSTNEVKNTFAPTNIDIDLVETSDNAFELIPGVEYAKDPIVKVLRPATDVEIYLFVKFDEAAPEGKTTKNYLTYTSTLSADYGWEQDAGLPSNVWYRKVASDEVGSVYTFNDDGTVKVEAATDCSWNLLVDNQVTVNNLKKTDMPGENEVYLSYTAYAIQTAGFENDVPGAWTAAQAQ